MCSAAKHSRRRKGTIIRARSIGETAGEVRRFLMDHGKSTLTAVEKGVKAPAGTVAMTVGWLAHEGKPEMAQEKRSVHL